MGPLIPLALAAGVLIALAKSKSSSGLDTGIRPPIGPVHTIKGRSGLTWDVQMVEAPFKPLSDGGSATMQVILNEAIGLSLSILACARNGVRGAVIYRDETGSALDPVNARAYIAMLRSAAEIIGASKILFVSHSAEVQAMADSRIEVRDGKVSVVS